MDRRTQAQELSHTATQGACTFLVIWNLEQSWDLNSGTQICNADIPYVILIALPTLTHENDFSV